MAFLGGQSPIEGLKYYSAWVQFSLNACQHSVVGVVCYRHDVHWALNVLPVSTRLSLYTSLFPQFVRLFLLGFIRSSDAVSLRFRFRSLAWSRLVCSCSISALARSFSHVHHLLVGPVATLLHFSSRTISFTHRLPSDRTSTTWLVVWERDHRNHAHAIKVCRIYIYTYMYIHTYIQTRTDNTAWLVASC